MPHARRSNQRTEGKTMSIHEEVNIYLQDPVDKVEYIANVLMNAYKSESKTWYDLAKTAIMAVEKYDHISRGRLINDK